MNTRYNGKLQTVKFLKGLYLKNNIFKIREFTMIDYLLNFLVQYQKNKFTNTKVHYLINEKHLTASIHPLVQ
jgi:hypothetical protein